MIRVLIADDESIFRMGLKTCINWQENGFEIIGEATNGKETIRMIEELTPDLVLLDIKMPVLDGISVIQEVMPRYPHLKIVVLSCLNEYEYVRKAMKLGASDYLFKPIMEAPEILNTVLEVKKAIDIAYKDKNHSQKLQTRQRQLEFLNQLLQENLSPDYINRVRVQLHIPAEEDYRLICVTLALKNTRNADINVNYLLKIVITLMEDALQKIAANLFCFQYSESGIICFLYKPACSLEGNCRQLMREISEHTGADLSFGISDTIKCLREMNSGWKQAQKASEDSFFTGWNCVNIYNPQSDKTWEFQNIFQSEYSKICDEARVVNIDSISAVLTELSKTIKTKKYYDKESFCHFLISLSIDIMRIFRNRIILEDLLQENYNMIAELSRSDTIELAIDGFISITVQIFNHANVASNSTNKPIVKKVQKFIQQNYMKDVTLDDIAAMISMNKNYFCKLYRQVTGESLFTYLAKTRVDAACQLLRNKTFKAYEIARAVGYEDYGHFCKTFKKYTGMSPTEMRLHFDIIEDEME